MAITFQPIQVATGCSDEHGLLVLSNGCFIALLVRLDDLMHEEDLHGSWFLECSVTRLRQAIDPVFATLEAAVEWIEGRLAYSES